LEGLSACVPAWSSYGEISVVVLLLMEGVAAVQQLLMPMLASWVLLSSSLGEKKSDVLQLHKSSTF
jgi:hypothetical protein